MTDKQVIVNDIAVSECEFLITNNDKQLCRCIKSDLFGGIEFVENAKNGNCKDNPDCYFKQLKRKEQECERYAKINEQETKDYAELLKQLAQLKATKEQAEQKLERIRDIADTIHKYANRLDENNWGIFDWKIIEQTKQITQIIDEVENE